MKLTQRTLSIRILLYLGIFLLLNLLIYRHFFRLDFTADKRYTLSQSTRDILEELDEPVTITAYFSEELPAGASTMRKDFQDLLYEYESASDGNLVFEFINPNESEEDEQKAQQTGIQPIPLEVRKRDKVEIMRAYMGAVIKKGAEEGVIPAVPVGAGVEYALSSSIKRMTVTEKPRIGFVTAHGEPGLNAMAPVVQELSTLYEVDTLSLAQANAWSQYKTLVILAPTDPFPSSHLEELNQFLSSGGRLFVGINTVGGDLNQRSLSSLQTGLDGWLGEKGIIVTPTVLTDARASQVQVQQRTSFGIIQTAVQFPYFPLIADFAEHPITDGMEGMTLVFGSPVELQLQDSTVQGGALAYTSEKTGKLPVPAMIDLEKQWTERDFPESKVPIAAWLEGNIEGSAESKIVVVGDGDFATQGGGNASNLIFLINAIDWLTDDTGLIELRTKGVDTRPIEKQLEDGERSLVKYTVFLLPILIVIGFAIFRAQARRNQRIKWMQEDYSWTE